MLRAKVSDFGTSRAKSISEELTMTAVGTPLYCAPEISLGHSYDEKIDAYSFGFLLLEMAIEDNIIDFISERWRIFNNKARAPKSATRILLDMSEKGWRPITEENPVAYAPKSINALITKCMSHDPKLRPSFNDILKELHGPCSDEISGSGFLRRKGDTLITGSGDRQLLDSLPMEVAHASKDDIISSTDLGQSTKARMRARLEEASTSSPWQFENPLRESKEQGPIVSECDKV